MATRTQEIIEKEQAAAKRASTRKKAPAKKPISTPAKKPVSKAPAKKAPAKPPAKKAPARKVRAPWEQAADLIAKITDEEKLEDLMVAIGVQYADLALTPDDDPDDLPESKELFLDYRFWWIHTKAELKGETAKNLLPLIGATNIAHVGEYDGEPCVCFPSLEVESKRPSIPIWNDSDQETLLHVPKGKVKIGDKLTPPTNKKEAT